MFTHCLQPPSHLVSIVDQFIMSNQMRLIERCFQLDETRVGTITAVQLQEALTAAGLDLSQVSTMYWVLFHKPEY